MAAGVAIVTGLAAACQTDASPGSVSAVEVSPAALVLNVGATAAVTAIVRDLDGEPVSNGSVHWSIKDPLVATVSPAGIVTARTKGRTQVAASREGKSGMASVAVDVLPMTLVRIQPTSASVQVGAKVTLAADVLDSGGGLVAGQTVTWSSANTAIATVSTSGVVSGVAQGNTVITARTGSLTGTAVVTVQPVSVSTVQVVPANDTVQVGKTLQLTVSLLDALGNVLTGRTVAWTSSDTVVATVSNSGAVRGRVKGKVTITAASGGKSGQSVITVQ